MALARWRCLGDSANNNKIFEGRNTLIGRIADRQNLAQQVEDVPACASGELRGGFLGAMTIRVVGSIVSERISWPQHAVNHGLPLQAHQVYQWA